ncbi:MAG: hypothetical protein JO150_13290 [Acidobacteriaceae bacterium]|nr:hypothetical protein [Acidobacteriaceae bacterium]
MSSIRQPAVNWNRKIFAVGPSRSRMVQMAARCLAAWDDAARAAARSRSSSDLAKPDQMAERDYRDRTGRTRRPVGYGISV